MSRIVGTCAKRLTIRSPSNNQSATYIVPIHSSTNLELGWDQSAKRKNYLALVVTNETSRNSNG